MIKFVLNFNEFLLQSFFFVFSLKFDDHEILNENAHASVLTRTAYTQNLNCSSGEKIVSSSKPASIKIETRHKTHCAYRAYARQMFVNELNTDFMFKVIISPL